MSQLVSTRSLDTAFAHIYVRRCCGDHDSDIWTVSLNWPVYREKLRDALLSGTNRLSPFLIGGLMLKSLDDVMPGHCFYARYMDDWVIGFQAKALVGLAGKTIANFIERLGRFYESGASTTRIAQYVRHWQRWCSAGL